jgi:hypothetical protein
MAINPPNTQNKIPYIQNTQQPTLPYDPLALARSSYDYTLDVPTVTASALPKEVSSGKKAPKLSGLGTNFWTALDSLFAAGTLVTNQVANWTDGKSDWKDIPFAESFTQGYQGMREAWKDGEIGLKDIPTFGFASGITEKGKKGKDIVTNLGLEDTKGKLDWADVIGFGADIALDPLTYLTLGGSSLIKAGARGVRVAAPTVLAKYGIKGYKAVGKNAEAIISNAEKTVINQKTAEYISKGASEQLATRLATKDAEKAVTELGDVLKASRSDAEKFIGFLDVPFTERTKGLIKRPEWLKRKAGEIGTDGAQQLVNKLVQKGMTNTEEIKAFFQKKFGKADPATLTRAESDYFLKELDRIRIANLPNAKVTEKVMKQFPQVTEDVQKAINRFQEAAGVKGVKKPVKAAAPATIEEMITIARGGQPAEQQAKTYQEVADYVKSELTQVAKGDAESLTRLIQSQFKVPRESARSIINQLKNDGVLVPSKQAGIVFDVNKGANISNLATKADVDRYIGESNENLYNVAKQLITEGNVSDVKGDKGIISRFVNDVDNGKQLAQKQIDVVRKRVTKYTGQTVPKVRSATSRASAESIRDRSSVAFMINKATDDIKALQTTKREASTVLSNARKSLKDQNTNAIRETKDRLRQVKDEAKTKVDEINKKITETSKKIEEYKKIIDDTKEKLSKAKEVSVTKEVITPEVKPVSVDSLEPDELKKYEKLLTASKKNDYLEEVAAERQLAAGARIAIVSNKSMDNGIKYKFTDAQNQAIKKLVQEGKNDQAVSLKEQFIQELISDMKAFNNPNKAVDDLNRTLKTTRSSLSKANKNLTSYQVELPTLQAKFDEAKKAWKGFDPASVSLPTTNDAVKAAEEALKQADDALTSKIDELNKLEDARKAESIPEQIRQMVQPTPTTVQKPKRTFRVAKPEFKAKPKAKPQPQPQKVTYDKVYGKRQSPDARPKVEEGLTKAQNLLKSWQAKEAQLRVNPPKVQAETPPVTAPTQAPRIPYDATETKAVEEHFAKEKGNTIKVIFKPYQGRPSNKFIKTFEDFLAFQITPRAKYAQEIALLTKATGTGRKPAVVKTKAMLQAEIDKVENQIQSLINNKLIVKQDGKNVVNTAINMSKKQKEYAESLIKQIVNLREKYDKAPVTAPAPKLPVAAVDETPKTINQKLVDDVAEKEKLLKQAREDYKKFLQGEYTVKVKTRNKQGEIVYTDKKITKPDITEEELIKLENETSKALRTMADKIKNQPIAETKALKLTASQQKKYDALKTDVEKADYLERLQVIDNLPPFKMTEKQMAKFNSLPEELNLAKKDRQRTKYFNELETEYVTKQLAKYYKEKGMTKARYTPSQLRELSKLTGKTREDFLAKIKDEAELIGRVRVFGELSDKIDNVVAMRQQLTEYQNTMARLVEQGRKLNDDFLNAQNALNKAGLPEVPKVTKTADPAIQKYNQDLAEARQNVLKYSDEVLKAEKALNDFDANIAYFSKLDQVVPVENIGNAVEQIVSTPRVVRFKPKAEQPAPTTGEMPKLDSDQMLSSIMQSLDEVVQGTAKTRNLVKPSAGAVKAGKRKSGTVKPVQKVTRMQQVLDEVEKAPPIVQREVEFIPRADAAKILNSNFRAFQGDMVGKSKLWGFLSKNKYLNPRTLGTGVDYLDSFGKDIKKTDIKMYGRKYEMMKDVAKIDKAVKEMTQDEIDSIIYFMQKRYPGKMNATQYFTKLGIDADGIERIKDVSIRMGKIFKKIGDEQQQAQLLGMLRRNYFPHVYKLSDEQSEMLLLRYEDDPIVKQLLGRSQKDGFSNTRKSFQTLAEFDDYLADMQKKITDLEAKPTLTDAEVTKLEKLQQKYTDLSDVIERNPVTALSRRYYKAIVSTTNRELINGLKQYGLIASKETVKKAGKTMIQLDAQNAGLLGLKSGDYINRDVFNGLKKIEGMFTDTGINNFINEVNSVQNIWKQAVTTIVPKYYITNFIGNVFNNTMAGVGVRSYREAGKAMRDYSKGVATPAQKQLIREAIDNGVLYQGWQADFRDAMDFKPKKDTGEKISDFIDKNFNKKITRGLAGKYKRGLEKFGDVSDDFARLAHYIEIRGKTNSVDMAADSVRKYLFNYRETTQLDKFLRGSVFPFWMWVRNNVPLQIDKILREPRFALTYFKLKREMQGGDVTPDDYPAWANEAGLVRNGVMYPTNLPINDLYKTLQSPAGTMRDIGAMLNPALKAVIEMSLNKQFYSNNRIAYPGTEVSDYGRYLLQSFGGLGKLPADVFFPKPSEDTNTGAKLIQNIGNLFVPIPRELE